MNCNTTHYRANSSSVPGDPTFAATRTWRATDACGNTAECSQTVTVEDHTPPTLTCVPNKTVECTSAWTFDAPTASDTCGNVTITIVGTVTNLTGHCGNTFAATRTWRATDACGNTAECSQTVTVEDHTPPTITCVPSKTVECTSAWTFDAPTASDTCGNVTITIVGTVTNLTGHCGNTFDATRTWRATDSCGNTAECSQTISVRDTTAPTLNCMPDRSVPPGVGWSFDEPVATDTCGAVAVLVINTITNTIDSSTLIATRTWQATDACGNTTTCQQAITVSLGDTIAPTVRAVVPANSTTGAPTSAQITGTFSEPMDAATINTTTFTLKQGTTPVAGTVTYNGVTATFTPTVMLAPLTTYTATITTGVRDLAGNALTSGLSWSFTTGAIPDTTAPVLGSTGPGNADTGVPINGTITATFSEAMNASTINTTTFTLTDGTTPVAGTVTYVNGIATFTPVDNLAPLTTYTATITTGAKDLAGNSLASDMSWSFTTGVAPDTTAPTVSSTVPANSASGAAISAQIAATFSEAMDASTINTTTFSLKQGTTLVAGTVSYVGVTAAFTPAANLAPLTTYTATISTGAKDVAGNPLAIDFVWNFTTGVAPDTSAPTVSATVPANSVTGVAISAQIAATFSEAIDAASINTGTFSLKQGTTTVAGTVSYAGVTATFTPTGNLAPLTTYTATLSGATDLAGNPLAADFVWSFTTGVAPDTTAPAVITTVPASSATGTAIGTQIAATFSEPMDAATINTATFTLKAGTSPVAGTVTYNGVTTTFTPTRDLAPLTTYTATISTGVKDLAGNALTTEMSWSFTTGTAPDTTAPVLGTTGPGNADTGVPINTTLTATFSEAMDASTINTTTFTVTDETTPVAGTVTYVDGIATFTPADNLAPLTTYTATITTGAKDLAGNALATDLSWSFTTGVAPDTTAPTVSGTAPADSVTGVAISAPIIAAFSEAMDASTINTTTFILTDGATLVAGTVSYANGIATFTPTDNLAPLTTYSATITTEAKDLAGNSLASELSWTFTTGAAPDTTAPVLGVTGPANAATNVPLNEIITVSFSEAMDPSTINTNTFTVMQGTTPVVGTATYTNGTATFIPADTLAPLTTYTVTIRTGATDLAGNPLSTDMSWSFTTGVAPDTIAPVLGATGPANAATNVALNEVITVSFSEAMDPSTINTNTFTVMQGTTPVAGSVTYTNGTATFTPADTLAPLTTYTVTISTGATDLAGNALSTHMSWSFTTVSAPTLPVVLESAAEATGPYADAAGQTVDLVTKTIVVPQSGNRQFYRIRSTTLQTITRITTSGSNVVLIYD